MQVLPPASDNTAPLAQAINSTIAVLATTVAPLSNTGLASTVQVDDKTKSSGASVQKTEKTQTANPGAQNDPVKKMYCN
jgi:hypothetical protein